MSLGLTVRPPPTAPVPSLVGSFNTVEVRSELPEYNPMAERNWKNRTLFHGDNLKFLRAMNSASVDLIATDPPFNKNRDFHATPDKLEVGARFQDRWSWERDVHQDWVDRIKDDLPAVWEVIDAANAVYMKKTKKNLKRSRDEVGSDMGAFLCFMAVRLLAMHRVLKPTGSMFLHCDHTASHYLKAVMDSVFGRDNFQNEIVWCYRDVGGGRNTSYYKRKHDTIFWYSKSAAEKKINKMARGPLSETTLDRFGSLFDSKGVITYRKLRDRRPQEFESRKSQGRVPDNLDQVFMSKDQGRLLEDYWTDINPVRKRRKGDYVEEPYWYPTQKPLALYERLIETATGEGDTVLDPFCGCATTLVAAENLNRQWVGIDIWDNAKEVVLQRLAQEWLTEKDSKRFSLVDKDIQWDANLPDRTDDGEEATPFLRVKERIKEPGGKSMTRADMYEYLLEQHGRKCQGCDRQFDDPRYLELDHNTPRSDGGLNHISNRVLLCGPCNKAKSNMYTLSGLRRKNQQAGWMAHQNYKLWGKHED